MFTGIIQAVGKVIKYDKPKLWIRVPFPRLRRGESIAVDGVCLTIAARRGPLAGFHVGPETARITTLGALSGGRHVNLERALRYGDRLGGHLVSGHVEFRGRIVRVKPEGRNRWYYIDLPRAVRPFAVKKGSVAVDGISLTIVSIARRAAKIMIIPHTLRHTTLGEKGAGDFVNLEPDMLAKYGIRRYARLIRSAKRR